MLCVEMRWVEGIGLGCRFVPLPACWPRRDFFAPIQDEL